MKTSKRTQSKKINEPEKTTNQQLKKKNSKKKELSRHYEFVGVSGWEAVRCPEGSSVCVSTC